MIVPVELYRNHTERPHERIGLINRSCVDALMQIMVELNEGIIDDGMDEDVEAILKEASLVSEGKLSKPSFVKAISLWYSICDERQQKREAAVKETACCVVC